MFFKFILIFVVIFEIFENWWDIIYIMLLKSEDLLFLYVDLGFEYYVILCYFIKLRYI